MFEKHFGLAQDPFSIAPDPRYLFLSPRHRDALAHLLYGVGGPEHSVAGGFVLLTGDIGTGKTTLCRCLLEQIPPHCHVAYIFNPKLTVLELLQTICQEFGIPSDAPPPATPKGYIDALNTYLLRCHGAGESCVLIIDEAQNLAPDVLEQLRLLTNLETHTRKLLQIVLIGQPELRTMLERPELEQLAQRVVARFHLGALDRAECAQYIAHRLSVAGHHGPLPFDAGALKALARLSGGVPRRINLLCGRALLGAYAHGLARVNRKVVQQAAQEVFGTAAARAPFAARDWLVGFGLLLALGAAGAWWWSPGVRSSLATRSTPGAAVAAATSAPTSEPARSASSSASATVPGASAAPASAPTAAQPGETLGDADQASALRRLLALWNRPPDGTDPCQSLPAHGLQCHTARALTLPQLRHLNRPGVLALSGMDGTTRYAVLLGLDAHHATLALPDGRRVTIGLLALAPQWRGEFTTVWQPPPGYVRRMPDGSQGPAIAHLARQLALAQGQPLTPASWPSTVLDTALREQLRAYQRAQGLVPDGSPGPLTYMQLESADPARQPRLEPR